MIVPNDSVLLIDKPLKWSSFDVVRYLKREYRQNTPKEEQIKKFKIGHAGTLDPLATGLLIVCTGKETKNINLYQGQTKEYIATVHFGATTKSFDAEFAPENSKDTSALTIESLQDVLPEFIGDITQVPPKYSALKIDGKRAYELIRDNVEFEVKRRQVTVHDIKLMDTRFKGVMIQGMMLQSIQLKITCSKGTYIRSLAHDIGERLKIGAYLGGLIRTQIGMYKVENAITIDDPTFIPSIDFKKD